MAIAIAAIRANRVAPDCTGECCASQCRTHQIHTGQISAGEIGGTKLDPTEVAVVEERASQISAIQSGIGHIRP
jgi:hypothetical protein